MRTSLSEIEQTEKYLRHEMTGAESLLFQAKMIVDPKLRINVFFQRQLTHIVRLFHREKLRKEASDVHHTLFNSSEHREFSEMVHKIFKQ